MASGLVPMTSLMSAERSLPPSSAGGDCLRYGFISTEIVGVGLKPQPGRRRRDDVVAEPVPIAVGDRCLLAREGHPDLRIGVARAVPPGQRVGPQGLLTLKLDQPAAGIGLAISGICETQSGDMDRVARGANLLDDVYARLCRKNG